MKGFTLIEVIIYCALLSLIITIACTTLYSLGELTQKYSDMAKIEKQGNLILRKSEYELLHDIPLSSQVEVQSELVSEKLSKKTISFSLEDHNFTLTQCVFH